MAKIISESAGAGNRQYGFIMDRFKSYSAAKSRGPHPYARVKAYIKRVYNIKKIILGFIVFSVSSSLIVVSSSVAVPASSSFVAASSAEASFLFIPFAAEIVLSVYFFYFGFCDDFEASITAYVQPHVASEQIHIAVLDTENVAFLGLVYVGIPKIQVNTTGFVANQRIHNSMRCVIAPTRGASHLALRYNLCDYVHRSGIRRQLVNLNINRLRSGSFNKVFTQTTYTL